MSDFWQQVAIVAAKGFGISAVIILAGNAILVWINDWCAHE